ncbi:MAG: glycosyltransferase family 39 protein [Desulfobulbaceae bacterium]|nr:glycosyltransferase family 39 protein [Desulfobulbaceae bacterium]
MSRFFRLAKQFQKLAYLFGKKIFGGSKVGLIAAGLLSVYPLDILYATRITTDIPLAFFTSATVFLFLLAEKTSKKEKVMGIPKNEFLFFLSGVSYSLTHSIKPFGVILLPLILLYLIYVLITRKISAAHLNFIAGAIPLLVLTNTYFYVNTGVLFLDTLVSQKAVLYEFNKHAPVVLDLFGIMQIRSAWGGFFDQLSFAFNFQDSRPGVTYPGIYFYASLLSVLSYYSFCLYKKHKPDRNFTIFSFFLVFGLFLLDFLPVSVGFENNQVILNLITKEPRMINSLSMPLVLLIAFGISNLRSQVSESVLLLLLAVTSLFSVSYSYAYFTEGISDMKTATDFLKSNNLPIYVDPWAYTFLQYNLGYSENYDLSYLPTEKATLKKNTYVLLSGARGGDLHYKYLEEYTPRYAKDALVNTPPNWELKLEVEKKRTHYRKGNLRIYLVR